MRKLIVSIAIASSAIAVAPASAQSWRLSQPIARQIQQDINQLDNRIQRAQQRRTISPREATGLRRDARDLQRMHNRYSRNGLNRSEVAALEVGVNRLHAKLRYERRDWDGRRG